VEPESEAGPRISVGSSKANARVHGLHSCGQSKESCLSIHLVANPLRCFFRVRAKSAVPRRVRISLLKPIALLGLLAVAGVAGCNRQIQHSPDVWAVVNGKEIRKDEVEKYYRTRVNP
jgi:hypothetical protein